MATVKFDILGAQLPSVQHYSAQPLDLRDCAHGLIVRPSLPYNTNLLLHSLPPGVRESLEPYLGTVKLSRGEILGDFDNQTERIWFPETCIVALVVAMSAGNGATVGLIGREGAVYAGISRQIVQVAGIARFIPSSARKAALKMVPELGDLLQRHADAVHGQVMQVAACNVLHPIEARLACFFLSIADRVWPRVSLPLTQDNMAHALGVQRCSVNSAATALQRAGLITYKRGTVTLQKRANLEAVACECYGVICSFYAKLYNLGPETI